MHSVPVRARAAKLCMAHPWVQGKVKPGLMRNQSLPWKSKQFFEHHRDSGKFFFKARRGSGRSSAVMGLYSKMSFIYFSTGDLLK
jgi:hypothetical protein